MAEKITIIKPGDREFHNSRSLRWVEEFSKYLDSKFTIPGTNIRFGFDPIMGLFPVVGDLITYVISGILIYTMYNHGASRKVVIKMIFNSTLDAIIGSIPLLGSVFDVFYRSNDRNVRLLKEHYLEGKHEGSGNGIIIAVVLVAIILVALAFYGMYKLIEYVL